MSYLGNNPNKGSFFQQKFTGDGSATTFTLLQSVTDGSQLIVTIGNVIQEEGSSKAYTASGSTLTFDSAPANGDIIVVRYLGRSLDTPTSYATQITFKYVATNGQTAFTGADANGLTLSYSLGSVDVYLNGVHLDSTDFTETNESTLTLASGATTNDELVIVAKRTITLADVVSKSNGGTFAGAVSFGGGIAGNLELVSTDAGASSAPIIELYRHSASPATSDKLGRIDFTGEDDNDDKLIYASIEGNILQPTDGNERGELSLEVMQNGSIQTFLNLTANTVNINRPLYLSNTGNSIIFEGATNDTSETTLAITDPSQDRTITLPDATGTVVLQDSNGDATIGGGLTVTGGTSGDNLLSFAIDRSWDFKQIGSGSGCQLQLKANTDSKIFSIANNNGDSDFFFFTSHTGTPYFYVGEDAQIRFEGSTADDNETILTVQDPTADRTITLPNASGTVITDGNADTPATTSSSSEVDHVLVNDGGVMKKSTIANLGISGGASLSNGSANRIVTCTNSTDIEGETFCEYNSSQGRMIYRSFLGSGNGTTYTAVQFFNLTSASGSIRVTQNSTSYNTSSDYRLKENITYDWTATDRLKQLKPARFNFIADDTNTLVDGFIAHEVSDVVPEAVGGEKDAVDEDGNIDPQGIDQSKLVPLLVKTIQELEARITELEK